MSMIRFRVAAGIPQDEQTHCCIVLSLFTLEQREHGFEFCYNKLWFTECTPSPALHPVTTQTRSRAKPMRFILFIAECLNTLKQIFAIVIVCSHHAEPE